MNTRTVCGVCKTEGVRLHCITNTYLQEIYEHDTGTALPPEDIKPLLACITCCDRLQHCYQVRNSCERRENALAGMVSANEQYSNTNMAAISPEEHQNTCVQSDLQKHIKLEPVSEVQVKEELTTTDEADETWQEIYETLKEDNEYDEIGLFPRIVSVKSETNVKDEIGSYEITTNNNIVSDGKSRDPYLKYLENKDIRISSINYHSLDIPLKTLQIVLQRCDDIYENQETRRAAARKPYEEESTQNIANYKNDVLEIITKSITSYNCKPVKCKVGRKHTSDHYTNMSQKLECDICNKRFKFKTPLINHIRIHTGEKPFKCNICNKSYRQISHLNRHSDIHKKKPNKKTFECNDCGKEFTQKSSLARHFRSHTDTIARTYGLKTRDKPHKCTTCFTSFDRKADLFKHNRIHTGEKPYKCNVCSKCFSAQSNLASHKRTHTGDKPFKCNICNKIFSRKNGLTKHNRVHTGDKPFKCDICSKLFTRKFSLVVHIRLHNAEKPYKCNNCNKCYTQKSHLGVHRRKCNYN